MVQGICSIKTYRLLGKLHKYKSNDSQYSGQKGKPYPNFINFTCTELKNILIFLFFKESLCALYRVTMKFKNQSEDPVNGNDFVKSHFGYLDQNVHFERWKSS